jgi:hypothetical protein
VSGTAHDQHKLGQLPGDAGRMTEPGNPADRGIVAELQEALLPTTLPMLPRARIAARYLVAGLEQAAGGDWFDAIPLDGGDIALVVGDVVGHGATASAAMGQLRAVLAELLAAEDDLGQVLRRADAFAARMPSLRATTLALVVLDPAAGTLRYTTCGHPPPLVIGVDRKARYPGGDRDGTARYRLAAGPGDRRACPGRAGPAVQRRPGRAAGPDHRRGHGRAGRGRRRRQPAARAPGS